ncbi:hypothetical protein [Microbulbifer sp. CnH-101-E]|jgi:hypothetical protein|uniref:hypothetical protein n=1 Tax=unclassified Microbulbifer TaxID=2619833 RepID=UPI004039DEE2
MMNRNSKQTYPVTEIPATTATSLLVAAQSQSISLAVQEGLCQPITSMSVENRETDSGGRR